MNHEDKVRYRNDGDDFHIIWTARRSLKLLDPNSNLVAVAIEGISGNENRGKVIRGGILGIDTALYYGSEELTIAEKIEYCQLKYSTTSPNKPWAAQEVSEVIEYFGERYLELIEEFDKKTVHDKVRFQFITNRPISTNILTALYDLKAEGKHVINARKTLRDASGTKNRFPSFIQLLELQGGNGNRHEQTYSLSSSLLGMTSSHDPDVAIRLKDLIHSKTLSDTKDDPVIRLPELLLKFGVDDKGSLLPAPSEIEQNNTFFPRLQEKELISSINDNQLTVLHAEGGIGKSVVVSRLPTILPSEFHCVIFDGFGGGSYRQETSPRHRFDFGLVQIANELAYSGLCDPIIPISGSEDHKVFKKFISRLEQSLLSLKANNKNAKLVLVFDAIDNTVMGANLAHDTSFVNAVLNEINIVDVHIVAVARTERLKTLPLPIKNHDIQLNPFTEDETKRHILSHLKNVDDYSILEFHAFTRGVPRVQAYYLDRVKNKRELVKVIRGKSKSSDELIGDEVQLALHEIKSFSDTPEKIDLLCIALAELPPLVPLHILSVVAEIDEQRIKSFINDLKYPLRISENGVQFRDEPVETWFRNNFNAEHENFEKFVSILSEKSVNDPYVATTFPRLLFAVKRYDELVALSLGDNLDFDDPVIKRETFKSRIEYSLKACLVTKKYDLACKLLFRFSEEVETTSRQSKFIQDNYALLAILASSSKVADVLFRKHKDDWYGIEQGRKAAIMSPHKLLLSECMQCLDMANVWLDDYLSKPKEEFHREEFGSEDIAAICFAILFIQTPERVVRYITGWSPKLFQTKCAYKLGINLLMLSPFPDSAFFKVTEAAKDKMHILIGLIIASDKFQVKIPNDIIDNVSEQLCDFEGDIEDWHRYGAIIVVEAICHDQSNPNLVTLLKKYSWPQQDYGFTGYGEAFDPKEWGMRYFSLQASFNHVDLSPEVILLPKEQMRVPDNYDETFKRINKQINYFGRVYEIRAKLLFGTIDNAKAIELFNSLLTTVRSDCYQLKHNYDLDANNVISFLSQAIFSTLCKSNDIECDKFKELLENIERIELHKPISIRINLAKYLVQFSSSDDISSYILELLDTAASRLDDYLESASDKAQTYADIAKVASIISNEDANAYLDIAFESLEQLDHNSREMLDACCSLANDVAIDRVSRPKEAYQLARISELIHSMNDHKFPWGNVVKSLTYLSPESSLAITSRWRERNVGWDVENIGVVSKYLVANKVISSSAIHSMEVYGEYWDYGQYFDLLLQNASCREECEQIYTLLINDVKSDKKVLSMGGSVEVENIAKKFKLHHFSFTGVAQLREKKERESTNPTYLTDKDNLTNKPELPANLAILIESFSFENIQNLLELINKINQEEFPRQWDWQDVFNALREKLTVKQRPKYFQYLAECYEIDHDDLLNEIEKCCQLWKTSPAIKKLQPLVIDTVITLRGVDIISSWYRASKQIKKLADIAKKDEAAIFSKLLATIVSHIDSLPSHSLQFLLRKTFQFFDIKNKSSVLEYALERFERYCGDDVADGKWQPNLIPPNNINDAIARYIWCGLASPESEIRWRSAHAIKRLCLLGQQKVINSLFNLLACGENTAFVDRRLPFYRMHAEMYFLMAIARVIHDFPKLFIEHSVVIFEFSTQKEPHVFIKKYAKSAALTLFNYDSTIYNQEQISLLNNVNTSLFSKAKQPKNRQYRNSSFGNSNSDFHFTNDMDRYWFPNLSDIFGIATSEIEKMASDLILNEWRGAGSWVWNDDTRAKYQLYIGDSHSTQGFYPETDRYSFYLGLHAMAIVAGQLLLKYPILEDSDDGDRFYYWLSRHTVSVDSAKWQSDRRNGCPLLKRTWMGNEYDDENWKWCINNQDFMDILIPRKGFIQLSSDIVFRGAYGHSEKIRISSALVTPNSCLALIRSLQLESNHHNYSIPQLGQHSHDQENYNKDFNMKGFIRRVESDSGIEQFDPLAGDIDFPAVTLGEDFVEQCGLVETSDGIWSKQGRTDNVFIAEIWGKWHRDKRDRGKGKGEWLIANTDELCSCLKILDKDIIIEMVINRDDGKEKSYSEYQYDSYVKIFVLKADGYLYELRRRTFVGSKAS